MVKGKTYLHRHMLLRESKRQRRWQHSASKDSLDLNKKRQYHHSQGQLQSDLENVLKTEGDLSTIFLHLSHGSCFLQTWRKQINMWGKGMLLALASFLSLK